MALRVMCSTYTSAGDELSYANTTEVSRTNGATAETIGVHDNTLASASRYIRVRVTRP